MKDKRVNKFAFQASSRHKSECRDYKRFLYDALLKSERGNLEPIEETRLQFGIIDAIRYITCVEAGINPYAIMLNFSDDIRGNNGESDVLAMARTLDDLERLSDKYLAEVVISLDALGEYGLIALAYIVAHEMQHVFQKFKAMQGRFAFDDAIKHAKCPSDTRVEWDNLRYDASLSEFDANYVALTNILRWIDEVETMDRKDREALARVKESYKSALHSQKRKFAGNVVKLGGFTILNTPTLIAEAVAGISIYDFRFGIEDSREVYKRNVIHQMKGQRTERSARRFIDEFREKIEVPTVVDKARFVDLEVALLAKRHGVNPVALGTTFVGGYGDAEFVDASGAREKRLLGVIRFEMSGAGDIEKDEFIKRVDASIEKIERDKRFIEAVDNYVKNKSRFADSMSEEMGVND